MKHEYKQSILLISSLFYYTVSIDDNVLMIGLQNKNLTL